jgi:cysteine desulfurase
VGGIPIPIVYRPVAFRLCNGFGARARGWKGEDSILRAVEPEPERGWARTRRFWSEPRGYGYDVAMKPVYLDHNATTPLDPRVAATMAEVATAFPGNPDSPHGPGRQARARLRVAQEDVAAAIGADPAEIIFTSGGTESCNLAVLGVARARAEHGRHVVITAVEHLAVLRSAKALTREGFSVELLPVDRDGLPDPEDLRRMLRDDTALVSVMLANNETGALLPVREMATIAAERGVPFHTDAVQALGKIPVAVDQLGVALLSGAAHKFYGPKGSGFLFVRRGTPILPVLCGGHQQDGLRPGTVDVPGAAGLATAIGLAMEEMPERAELQGHLTTRIEDRLLELPGVTRNGPEKGRLPGTVNITVADVAGEALMIALDREGFSVGTGSACATGAALPSHVLAAMGLKPREVTSSIRLSLGRGTGPDDIDRLLAVFPEVVERLRKLSTGTLS